MKTILLARALIIVVPALVLAAGVLLHSRPALAGACDAIDGTIVKTAQKAIAAGDVNLALPLVKAEYEEELRVAFARTMAVRKLGDEARELADYYFYETVVRLHKAGAGEPYTGLKPAGLDSGPVLPTVQMVFQGGSVDNLVDLLVEEVRKGVLQRYEHWKELKAQAAAAGTSDVETQRKFQNASFEFGEYALRVFEATHSKGHFSE